MTYRTPPVSRRNSVVGLLAEAEVGVRPRFFWGTCPVMDRVKALRGPGESYSDAS